MSAPKRKNAISGQFAARLIEMMESPAYRVLSLSGHRVLSRIEIEYAHHGGQDNGKLPVTFDDFEAYGIHRTVIRPAIDEVEALGFIEVTERGSRALKAEYRRELAIEWWGKAGDQALRRSAFQEAIAHLSKAIAMKCEEHGC